MATEIRVPALGESVTEAQIGQWFKNPGDAVMADEPLVELETDKVTIEVPAPADGVLEAVEAKEGETVEVNALLGSIAAGEGVSTGNGAAEEPAKEEAKPAKPAEPEAKSEGGSGKLVDVVVPSGGESVTEAEVGEWFKDVGDSVSVDEPIVSLETDKAAQDVMAQEAGTIAEIVAKQGEVVEVGAVLARINMGGSAGASPGKQRDAERPAKSGGDGKVAEPAASKDQIASYTQPTPPGEMAPSPAAAKMIAEKNLDSTKIEGSGKHGQVLKGDVISAIESGARAPAPSAASAQARPASSSEDEPREERVKMTRLRQTIARRLKDAQNTAAMLTTFNEVDMGPVMELRKSYKELFEKKHGVKLGFMGFFAKAVTHALKEIPAVNAEIDGTDIVYKNFAHIGVAVGTDKGLVVPVVRDADQMTIAEIEKEVGRLGSVAREGKLSVADMQGGTFTISNGGVYGSLMSTPILNAPQSGILGMHKIDQRPVVKNSEIVIASMMYLALSYDHRIVDGKEAVTFLVRVKESLEDPQRLVLDL